MKTTFIYSLIDPRNNAPFYIGKSNNPEERFKYGHLNDINKKYLNKNKCVLIKEIINHNYKPILEIEDIVKIKDWKFWEKHYISLYRSWGFNLTNKTEGGDGGDTFTNNHNKEEIRKKFSKIHLNRKQSEKQIFKRVSKLIGQKRTEKQLETMSIAQIISEKFECLYCHRFFKAGMLKRFHGENCKFNPNPSLETIQKRTDWSNTQSKRMKGIKQKRGICFVCGEERAVGILKEHHNEKCKYRLKNITLC